MNQITNSDKEILRLVIAGSVDDGKSTLIGRLFFDLDEIYNDQLNSLRELSRKQGFDGLDFSLFTDGLSAEQEQKITIDVAYRYFSTDRRRYIIADVPGHEQYTRNMITGASNANLALILVDARKGLLPQSRRHLSIAALLGIKHILVVINKMDLVGYQESRFIEIREGFSDYAAKLGISDLQFTPISATTGEMVVNRGENMGWYQGPTVLSYLENVSIAGDYNLIDFRFSIQGVVRPNQDFRGYLGRVLSGEIKIGEEILILPSSRRTKIKSIIYDEKDQSDAVVPQSVLLSFTDEVDASRGDVVARINNLPDVASEFDADIFWLSSMPLDPARSYLIKHCAIKTRCVAEKIYYRLNIETLHRENADRLEMNEIGKLKIKTVQPLVFDAYKQNRQTGCFILIDEISGETVAAGIIIKKTVSASSSAESLVSNLSWKADHDGAVIWFTGLSGSGKSTIADETYQRLKSSGYKAERLDGDLLREFLCRDLGFSKEDRDKNIERAAFIAGLLAKHGIIVLATFISPYYKHRSLARQLASEKFLEIFVDTSLAECERRDVKGLYQKAKRGEIENFTGVSDVYEAPKNPDLVLATEKSSLAECVEKTLLLLKERGIIK